MTKHESLLLILNVCFICLHVVNAKWRCDAKDREKMDDLVGRIMTYGRVDRKFPVNKLELKPYCK